MNSKYYEAGKDVDVLLGMSGFALKTIVPNSKVLEFGPSYGRMTKYMKEELNCDVTIIEYNKSDFKMALQYASFGLNEDIDDLKWCNELQYHKYDYIVFTDVLEHLRNPEIVLQKSISLLKENGSIIFSVPNVAHGDILLQMYYNCFNYQSTGLLDNTHIHLWAKENILQLIKDLNLNIKQFVTMRIPMFETEAGTFINKEAVPQKLIDILKERGKDNDIYEFGIEVGLNEV